MDVRLRNSSAHHVAGSFNYFGRISSTLIGQAIPFRGQWGLMGKIDKIG
jgi:hypothetical protein